MEYVSSKKIALRWGVSERLVQRYCLEKRISGATKFGHYWMIPSSAEKPIKNKRIDTSKENINDTCVTGLPEWKVPGEAEHVLPKLSGDKAKIFEMKLAYYRGQANLAYSLARTLLEATSYEETKLVCLQVILLCSVFRGNKLDWDEVHKRISELVSWRPEAEAMKELVLASVRISFIDLSTVPDWIKEGEYSRLPDDDIFYGVFLHIKYLQFTFKFELAKYVTKMALTRNDFMTNPIARSYLELTLASVTHSMNDDEAAKAHIRIALKYIIPDGLYSILAESFGWLDTLIKDVMLEDGMRDQWRILMRIYEQYKLGWIKLGQYIIGEQWTVELTLREWSAIKYAAMGLTTAEIANRMSISVDSIKKYLGSVYDKLSISGRDEIKSLLPLYGSGETDKNTSFPSIK